MPTGRQSIEPTYDATKTGPRYWLTSRAGGRTLDWQKPLDDPFVHTRIVIGWRDLLRGLLRRHLAVTVQVGGDRDVIEDVLELNSDYLGPMLSTRRREFQQDLNKALVRHVDDEEFKDITRHLDGPEQNEGDR